LRTISLSYFHIYKVGKKVTIPEMHTRFPLFTPGSLVIPVQAFFVTFLPTFKP